MTESGFEFDRGDAGSADPMPPTEWHVRFAGRRSGPFGAERLRTLARRGALTRMHSLSADGKSWVPATSVRAIFAEDGSVVTETAAVPDSPEEPADFDGLGDVELELPSFAWRPRLGGAFVRPVVIVALALATVALSVPTSRDEFGCLAWWWSEGAIGIATRGLCAVAVLGGWFLAFLPPAPVRSASVSAVAAVLASSSSFALGGSAGWAVPAALLVPVAALLVALDAAGSSGARGMGWGALSLSVILGAVALALGVRDQTAWSIAGGVTAAVGAGALGFAGLRAGLRRGPSADGVFWGSVVGSALLLGTTFVASVGALLGPAPMNAATGAATACLVLAFSALAWAAVHESVETAHLLPRSDDEPAAEA